MGGKLKVTVTLDEALVGEIDRLSKEQKESRSHMVEEAVKAWHRKILEKELIEGYLAMRKEDAKTAEANLKAGMESLK